MNNKIKTLITSIVATILITLVTTLPNPNTTYAETINEPSGMFTGIVIDNPVENLYVCDFSGIYFVINEEMRYNIGEEIKVFVDKEGIPLNIADYNYNFEELFE